MKTAVIQLHSQADKQKNIHRAVALVRQAIQNKAKLICLPEFFTYRGKTEKDFIRRYVAEGIPGESLRPFLDLARRHRVFILAGTVYEKAGGGKIYDTAVFIDDRGNIAGKYRKRHLFNARLSRRETQESRIFSPGHKTTSVRAGKLKIGLAVCFDLRFPEQFRRYQKEGCQAIAVPSSFTARTGQAHWEVLLRARAIENQCYVLAPNQTGRDTSGAETYGHSMIVGPWGEILAQAKTSKDAVIYAQIKLQQVQAVRKKIPLSTR